MENRNLNIEDLFRQSFDGYKIEPSKSLWDKISLRLSLKQFFKADFNTFNVYYSSIIVVLVTSLVLYLSPGNNNQLVKNQVKTDISPKQNSIKVDNQMIENKISINNLKENKIQTHKMNENSKAVVSKQISYTNEKDFSSIFPIKNQNINQESFKVQDSLNKLNTIIPSRPKPLFTLACKEGCVPFELKLKNYTQNAINYSWSFGDGGFSNEKSPDYTYENPGIYRIQLKAVGLGGTAISIIDSIIVHDKPTVKSYWPFGNDFFVGEKINIPVDAQNASKFEWNFGDGSVINKKLTDYSYKSVGGYSIILKSWSDYGCMDSLKIADINVIKSNKSIIFPNAFYPNLSGPSTGKYPEKETYVDIFHPMVKGSIAEYKLVIYSRLGLVVFQTNDVKTGWDGYYEQRIMQEGVYPYIAIGKFEGGESFLKKGNVTIFYRK